MKQKYIKRTQKLKIHKQKKKNVGENNNNNAIYSNSKKVHFFISIILQNFNLELDHNHREFPRAFCF